jgi:hypothetical protein
LYSNKEKEKSTRAVWVEANRHKIRANQTKWRTDNPIKYMLVGAKARAKRKNIEFDLKIEDIDIPEYCPILNIKLEKVPGKRGTSPSIDRVDPTLGYTKSNTRIISTKANAFKANMSKEDIERLYAYVLNA